MVATAPATGFQAVTQGMKVTLLAAVSADGFISTGKGVPWHLPADKAHFRARAQGQWLLVGRRTYEEMTGWFHHHRPLVLSSDPTFQPAPGHQRVASVAEALETARQAGAQELVVIGGGQVYALAMPHATHLDLTLVQDTLGQGVPFPKINANEWKQVANHPHSADAEHERPFSFTEWERLG